MNPRRTYVVISPVKDEERHLGETLRTMTEQTHRPARWVIVDDGSSDRSAEMAEASARDHDWIRVVRLPKRTERQPGSPVVLAFQAGYETIGDLAFDFVVKLDCDLRLPATYFEQLLDRFEADPKLGIASGVYREWNGSDWVPVEMPEYHAAGACKVIRAECWQQIGGFVASRGWDTVDEIRAQYRGWRTCHFPDLTFDHLRAEGSSRGPLYTSRLHGEVYYLTGGPLLFFAVKCFHRMLTGQPVLLSGLMLIAGYLKPLFAGQARLVSRDEARLYRKTMNQRIWSGVQEKLERFRVKSVTSSSGRSA